MKKIVLLFFILITLKSLYSKTIDEIVNGFISAKMVQYEHIGRGSTKSELYQDYKLLVEMASVEKLLELSTHENPIVRCYAGWGLIDKKYENLESVFEDFLNNDAKILTQRNDILDDDKLSDEFYHRYWNFVENKSEDKMLFNLDSIILSNQNADWLLISRALENRIYPRSYHKQIEHLAFDQHDFSALFYLSNWYKAEYKEQLKIGLVEYLKSTNFKDVGVTPYFQVINELFKFNDKEIEKIIVDKLRKDTQWKFEKQRFLDLLNDNSLYEEVE
jgi:hypothetical protein